MSLARIPMSRIPMSNGNSKRLIALLGTLSAFAVCVGGDSRNHNAMGQIDSGPCSASADLDATSLGDAWRRTATGWEQLNQPAAVAPSFAPTDHFSVAQSWPAAWAATLALSVMALNLRKRSRHPSINSAPSVHQA